MTTFNEVNKEDELEYNKWVNHINRTKDKAFYAIRRMDLLIISICGAGIYIVFETFKAIKAEELIVGSICSLKLSGLLFLVAISINFISQLTGKEANKNEENYSSLRLRKIEGKNINKVEQKRFDKKSKCYNSATKWLNISSIVLMFFGLILLSYFNYYCLF